MLELGDARLLRPKGLARRREVADVAEPGVRADFRARPLRLPLRALRLALGTDWGAAAVLAATSSKLELSNDSDRFAFRRFPTLLPPWDDP